MRLRLDKFLAHKAFGTRKEVHGLIKKGIVAVNGQVVRKKDVPIDTEKDAVTVKGEPVSMQMTYYVAFNKPAGYICAVQDDRQPTVMELLPPEFTTLEVFPVGRLDKDTEGLLLLTNDGNWAHRIINGKKEIAKVYYVEYKGTLSEEGLERIATGLELGDGTQCKPAQLTLLGDGDEWREIAGNGPYKIDGDMLNRIEETGHHKTDGSHNAAFLTITEGKFHQVKRMIGTAGGEVVYLKRLSVGPFDLSGIEETGQYITLLPEDYEKI